MTYQYNDPIRGLTQRRKTGLAITALCLGIASVVCVVGPLAVIPSLIIGSIAAARASRWPDAYGGVGMAVSGIALSVLGTATSIVVYCIALPVILVSWHAPSLPSARRPPVAPPSAGPSSIVTFAAPTRAVPIQMHDESALSTRYFYDRVAGFRIRFPKDLTMVTAAPPPQDVVRMISAEAPARTMFVALLVRRPPDFQAFVDRVKREMMATTKRLRDITIVSEGSAVINGTPAYVLEATGSSMETGIRLHYRLVVIDGGMKRYLLFGGIPDDAWTQTICDTIDSSFSTFESGRWPAADGFDPPDPAIPFDPFGTRGGRGVAGTPPISPRPTPMPMPGVSQVPLHLTFTDLSDALPYLRAGRPEERRAAVAYVQAAPVVAPRRSQIAAELEKCLLEPALRSAALAALVNWADKENLPAIRDLLASPGGVGLADRKLALDLLIYFHDAPSLAAILGNPVVRADASAALMALGPDAEDAVFPVLNDSDTATALEAIAIITRIGTVNAVMPLQEAAHSKLPAVARTAPEALSTLASRLNLKPEQYLTNLIGRYIIEAPAGFSPDTLAVPNTLQWSRAGPARAVRSVYNVEVRHVADDFKLDVPPGSIATLQAGPLIFRQMVLNPTRLQRITQWAAVDGAYLIILNVAIDNGDTAAENAMTGAAKRIRAKSPPTQPATTRSAVK